MRALIAALVVLALLLGAATAWAQGCALCKTAAAAAAAEKDDGGKVINQAILVLLIPTLSIFVGILVWAFRHSRSLS